MYRSNFVYNRIYKGTVKAVILDWSGTTIDPYVMAPAVVFVDLFKKFKVPISMSEAREPMGLRKDLHIKALTEMPDIRQRWYEEYGKDPTQGDVDTMFKQFIPMQLKCLSAYTKLLPDTLYTVNRLRKEFDIKIGSTTGFTREMVNLIAKDTAKQGYVPNASVAGDDVLNGARPGPHMVHKNMDLLNIETIQSVVKVDDTVSGVGEGLNAGCWTVGIARWSNYMDIDSLDQEKHLTKEELQYKLDKTRGILGRAGSHYVIDTLKELPDVVKNINERLNRGESP